MEAFLQVDVIIAGLTGKDVIVCSRKVAIQPDVSLDEATSQAPFDAIILPGGLKGAEALCDSPAVGTLLKQHESAGHIVAAICAGLMCSQSHCQP